MAAAAEKTEPESVRVNVPPAGYGSVGPDTNIPPPAYAAQPPTYDAATDLNAPPPTYDSLYGEFRGVRSPRGFWDWFLKVVGVILGTVAAAILIAILNAVPIYMIVVGSLNVHDCPVDKYIPIWLIVAGVFSIVKSITNFFYRAKRSRDGQDHSPEENVNPNPFDGILSCFLLGWFIAGTVWVYRIHEPNYLDPGDWRYCDRLTYMSAFVIITVTYCLAILSLLFACCCGCVAIFCCINNQDERD